MQLRQIRLGEVRNVKKRRNANISIKYCSADVYGVIYLNGS